ncbi:helical backbone metal receptor [Thermoflexus sp.]|uniref:helical backbone metal receptor n=1 Tax=Thermoflexus sp. TaxID=1969742 RepID=UPI00174FB9F2|nr:helical backbone metal receptor [Thermoflexus sp.]
MRSEIKAPLWDLGGRPFRPERPPRRIVSLVPSLTETLFDLGLGDRVVGRTDYCIHPAEARSVPSVGGTKNPDLDRILALRPDVVFVNVEENREADARALAARGIPVAVSFPRSVVEALDLVRHLTALFGIHRPPVLEELETLWVACQRMNPERRPRVFCPIWKDPWMTFNAETYAHDVLTRCGGDNVFASRRRRYPLAADLNPGIPARPAARDDRYPRLSEEEIRRAAPELILLPSEPYPFRPEDAETVRACFADTPAGRTGRVRWIDGSLLFWHGTRLRHALRILPPILQGAFASEDRSSLW